MPILILFCIFVSSTFQIFNSVYRILICAPTNASVDMILDKLVHTRLFDKTQLRRLLGYNHFVTKVYDPDLEDYCSLPESNHAYNGPEHLNIGTNCLIII